MNRRTLLLVSAMAVLAAASTWLSRENKQEAKQAVNNEVPDYFVGDFTATQMGPDGRPVRRLEAENLSHFPDTRILVTNPHLTLYQETGNPWEVTSRTGALDDQGDLVQLSGDVHLFRQGPEPADVVTQTLRIQPPIHYAETDDPITFTSSQGRVNAVGMQAWLEEQRVLLRSRVKGIYDR